MSSVRVRGALPAVLADGFGPEAAFTPLVAELDGSVVGYAFFSAGYNTDVAAWAMPSWSRSRRRRCEPAACRWSGACTRPTRALEFYRRLGAVAAEVRIMGVSGERLRALATAAP